MRTKHVSELEDKIFGRYLYLFIEEAARRGVDVDNVTKCNKENKLSSATVYNLMFEYASNERAIYVLGKADDYSVNHAIDRLLKRQHEIRTMIMAACDPSFDPNEEG